MKSILSSFLFSFLLLLIFPFLSINAVIIETETIQDILPYADQTTLVLFDFDDTLVDSEMSLGSGVWRIYIRERIAELEKRGVVPKDLALAKHYTFIGRTEIPSRPAEGEITLKVIQSLKDQDIAVLCLTARPKAFLNSPPNNWYEMLTFRQLGQAKISLKESSSMTGLHFEPSLYEKGVIFAGDDNKGPILRSILEESGFYPQKILFIDDKREIVQNVEKSVEELGIEFVGFWYRCAENTWKDFDPLLANIQWETLLIDNVLLTDAEAQSIKETFKTQDADAYFEQLFQKIDPQQIVERNYQNINTFLTPAH